MLCSILQDTIPNSHLKVDPQFYTVHTADRRFESRGIDSDYLKRRKKAEFGDQTSENLSRLLSQSGVRHFIEQMYAVAHIWTVTVKMT